MFFTKYAWVKPLNDKKDETVLNVFIKIVNESNCKPNKLWVDQENIIYSKLIQEWLDSNNNILMYSTLIEAKSVIAERFIKTLKAKIYEIMTTKDSKLYIAYLNKAVDQYNNSYHWRKRINSDYSALTEKIVMNHKAPKFKNNDRVRITKYKNIFSKGYNENWSRETFIIDSILKSNPRAYKLKLLNYYYYYYYYYLARYTFVGLLTCSPFKNKYNTALDHATGVDTSGLAAKKRIYCLEGWSWQTRH